MQLGQSLPLPLDLVSNGSVGADYSVGVASTTRVALGPTTTAFLMNSSSPSEIIFSNSSTQLAENLARALEPGISPGDEFITTLEHEANVGAWHRLGQRTKNKVHLWQPSPLKVANGREENKYAVGYHANDLIPLLNANTRLVAISACSNILGSLVNIKELVKTIKQVVREKSGGQGKVEVVVDCVAYAPHRRIDVQDWDVEYAFFSYYKVCECFYNLNYSKSLISAITGIWATLCGHVHTPIGHEELSALDSALFYHRSNKSVSAWWSRIRTDILCLMGHPIFTGNRKPKYVSGGIS